MPAPKALIYRSPAFPKSGCGFTHPEGRTRGSLSLENTDGYPAISLIRMHSITSENGLKMNPKSASKSASKIARSSYQGSSEEVHRRYWKVHQLSCHKNEARVADSDPRLQSEILKDSANSEALGGAKRPHAHQNAHLKRCSGVRTNL